MSIASWNSLITLTRKLAVLRRRLKSWCLDRKLFWGINWKSLFDQLQHYGNQVQTKEQGMEFLHHQHALQQDSTLAFSYWHQRLKSNLIQVGDLPSKVLF